MLTSNDICNKARSIASEKTLYVKGGGGTKLTQQNKMRFSSSDMYNAKRTQLIFEASEDTRAFDEFGLLASVSGYNCRNIGEVAALCDDISKDFSTIVPGEIVFNKELFGIFVGDGEVVTVNPSGVVIIPNGDWVSHGKLPEVDYYQPNEPVETEVVENAEGEVEGDTPAEEVTVEESAAEIIDKNPSSMEIRRDTFRRRH